MPASPEFGCKEPHRQPRSAAPASRGNSAVITLWTDRGWRNPDIVCIYSQQPNDSPSFVVHRIWYGQELELPGISSVMIFPSGNLYWTKKTWFCWSWFKFLMLWSASLPTSVLLTSFFKTPCLIHFPQDFMEEIFGWWRLLSMLLLPQLHKHSCRNTPFSGLFSCCSDAYHCHWVESQLPGQSLMDVVPQHCALDPMARCLPAGLL